MEKRSAQIPAYGLRGHEQRDKRLGHSSVTVTERIYPKLRAASDRDDVARTALAFVPAKSGKLFQLAR